MTDRTDRTDRTERMIGCLVLSQVGIWATIWWIGQGGLSVGQWTFCTTMALAVGMSLGELRDIRERRKKRRMKKLLGQKKLRVGDRR